MHIDRFDPLADPARTRACYQVYVDSAPVDDPLCPPVSLRAFTAWLVCGWTEDEPEVWSAGPSPDQVDGWYTAAMPQRENPHLVHIHPQVRPARRCAGVGTAMLRHAAGQAADMGRGTLSAEARDGSASEAFAQALGATRGITEVRRTLDLASVQAGTLAGLRAEATQTAHGYRLVSWEGTVPDEHLDQIAVVSAALSDAPHDPDTQAQVWDTERVRAGQRRVELQGQRYYSVAAQFASTGELAGLTQFAVDPASPEWGIQELTAVTKPHRGHQLGLLLKVGMLDWLAEREPQLRWVITRNADSNSHMIAINERLGFLAADDWTTWQLDVAKVAALR
jgi:GNAT superfamily N-acetyltransferase